MNFSNSIHFDFAWNMASRGDVATVRRIIAQVVRRGVLGVPGGLVRVGMRRMTCGDTTWTPHRLLEGFAETMRQGD